ncbi:hypothetical protein ASG54_08515 [Aureimonas sp. Leaf460]|nr:hypothetical protein ASG62_24190 [Aureimonas sp. Leaf427]KQT79597.1 hypothetical protein ASG54_08515 [Aureimonas sp. Leaf460]
MAGDAPTTREFQDAATAVDGMGGDESGLKPLMDNGRPVERINPATGMVSKAYVTLDEKVIVAFGGTTSGMAQDPGILGPQLQADMIAGSGGAAPAQVDAADFTRDVQGIADQQGIGSDNVYVSGHSLGGMESQSAAQQTGAGGMAFESPGIRPDPDAPGKGDNFLTVSDQSDPIATLTAGGPHYGRRLNVNTGMGPMAHIPGAQTQALGSGEGMSLSNLIRQLQ